MRGPKRGIPDAPNTAPAEQIPQQHPEAEMRDMEKFPADLSKTWHYRSREVVELAERLGGAPADPPTSRSC